MEGWREYTLKDAPLAIIDGDRGTHYPSQSEFYDKGFCLFLSAKNVTKNGFDYSSCQFINKEKDNLLRKGRLEFGDTILTTRGTVGNVAFFSANSPFEVVRINSGMVIIRPETKYMLSKFCFYMLINLQTVFESFVSGSAQPQLPIKDLHKMTVLLPSLAEQQAIAAVLSSLDDKIDLLHLQNKTLEALAQTLFRQWFVEEADAGWVELEIGNVVTILGGTTPSTKKQEYWNGEIHWTSPRDLSNSNSLFLFDTERMITQLGLEQIGSGLMPKGTVLMSSRAPIGYLAITNIDIAINQGYIAMICDKDISNYFMYLWCKQHMEEIKNAGNGSTFEEISKSNFKSLRFVMPPETLLKQFDEIVSAQFQKILKNQAQIFTLTKLRDILLPKLMSGEVRVEV